MRKEEIYVCEICGEKFEDEYECKQCEDSHIIDFSERPNKDLIEYLNILEISAYGYRFGKTTMGIHISTFKNLMSEAAKRLGKEE